MYLRIVCFATKYSPVFERNLHLETEVLAELCVCGGIHNIQCKSVIKSQSVGMFNKESI